MKSFTSKKPLVLFSSVIIGLFVAFVDIGHTEIYEEQGDCVFVLHGLSRTSATMGSIAEEIHKQGYKVINIDYPARKHSIENLSKNFIEPVVKEHCNEPGKTRHFVTHSLGGIIVRHLVTESDINNVGRIVMLAPPNGGSELADMISEYDISKIYYGPALMQLKSDSQFLKELKLPDAEVGIIAGNETFPISGDILPGDDDGIVSLASTQLPNMKDFIIVPKTHSLMMYNDEIIAEVVNFLNEGEFNHDPQASSVL